MRVVGFTTLFLEGTGLCPNRLAVLTSGRWRGPRDYALRRIAAPLVMLVRVGSLAQDARAQEPARQKVA